MNHECTPEEYARRKARWLLKDAIRYGKMQRGTACELEGGECDGPIEAHHDDYSKPYEVRWICRKHHRKIDGHKLTKGGWTDASLRAYWQTKHPDTRTGSEGAVGKGNRKAINMRRPNHRYDRREPTV